MDIFFRYGVKIVGPEDILEKVKTEVERLSKQYFE